MKSVILSVIVVLCFVSCSLAAMALGPAQVQSSHPNHCYLESKNEFYKPGESWTEEDCTQASCIQVNYTGQAQLMISYATCGVVAVDPPCYISENKALNYPECCPEPVCPEESAEEELPKSSENTNAHNTYENNYYKYNDNMNSKNKNNKNHKEILNDHNDSENELIDEFSSRMQNVGNNHNAFRSYPWDDDYFYADQDQDHMDNNVEDVDLQYLDYYPTERRVSPKFTRHDFNIQNFKWF